MGELTPEGAMALPVFTQVDSRLEWLLTKGVNVDQLRGMFEPEVFPLVLAATTPTWARKDDLHPFQVVESQQRTITPDRLKEVIVKYAGSPGLIFVEFQIESEGLKLPWA